MHVDIAEPSQGSRILKKSSCTRLPTVRYVQKVCKEAGMGHVVPFRLGLSLYIPCTVQVNDKFLFMTSRVRLVLRLVLSAHCKGLPPDDD